MISVVVPCYNEQEVLQIFYEEMNRVSKLMPDVNLEILLVNDGSKDNTLNEMKYLHETDKRVRYLFFLEILEKKMQFIQDWKIQKENMLQLMDVDLQDPPELLPEIYKAVTEEEHDSVATRRVTRKGEPPIRSFFARQFYSKIAEIKFWFRKYFEIISQWIYSSVLC